MRVVRVQGLLDNSIIMSWRMLMNFLGGCITTSLFWVSLMTWFSWALRMKFFKFGLFTFLWKIGEWSLSRIV